MQWYAVRPTYGRRWATPGGGGEKVAWDVDIVGSVISNKTSRVLGELDRFADVLREGETQTQRKDYHRGEDTFFMAILPSILRRMSVRLPAPGPVPTAEEMARH